MRKREIAAYLPVRRGLDEREAATYLSFSTSFFRRLVEDGMMPKPRVAKGRMVWDRLELDAAFDALPRDGDDESDLRDSWADYQ